MKLPLIISLCLLSGWQAFSQISDIASLPAASKSRVMSYLTLANNHAVIYSGKEELGYPAYVRNHPYFPSDQYLHGDLSFDGVVYPDVLMRLNVHREELVVTAPNRRFHVIIPRDRLDYATLNSNILFYNGYRVKENSLPEGYFFILYQGRHAVIRRETAFLDEQITDMAINVLFNKRVRYYVYKDGQYHPVSSKGSVLKLFNSHKKELNQFIKEQHLDFKHATEHAIVAVSKHYETLIRQL
ncbi:hypothetical protein [Parabacteroides sp. PF5-9]|uniref:hypothetical protein n=1 Tax=Parabacteroides sp. PF5-9 TaxID=1742404 RepID=UPI002473201F|nr:hypothetical protein [Parabacteroides sp. PF5-9]MDH6356770.1 hypothetical protein [Parabacteroides sp. PF5-9]